MKFILFRDRKKEFRWKLVARNGRSIAVSGEGYKRKAGALKSIELVWYRPAAVKIEYQGV